MYPSRARKKQGKPDPAAAAEQAALIGLSISSIKPQRRDPLIVLIRVRGKRAGILPAGEVQAAGVSVGAEWTAALDERCRQFEQLHEVKTAALRLLSRAAQTRAGLLRKLQFKRFDGQLCGRVVADLERRGLVNDVLFAETFTQSRFATKRMGRSLIMAKMIQRGVPRQIASDAIAAYEPQRDPYVDALALVRKRAERIKAGLEPQAVRRRLFAMLARRGYDAGTCFRAVDAVLKDRSKTRA